MHYNKEWLYEFPLPKRHIYGRDDPWGSLFQDLLWCFPQSEIRIKNRAESGSWHDFDKFLIYLDETSPPPNGTACLTHPTGDQCNARGWRVMSVTDWFCWQMTDDDRVTVADRWQSRTRTALSARSALSALGRAVVTGSIRRCIPVYQVNTLARI